MEMVMTNKNKGINEKDWGQRVKDVAKKPKGKGKGCDDCGGGGGSCKDDCSDERVPSRS